MTRAVFPYPLRPTALALACVSGMAFAASANAQSDPMGAWRDYARQGMTPSYEWNSDTSAEAPSVLSEYRQARRDASERRNGDVRAMIASLSFDRERSAAGQVSRLPRNSNGLLSLDRSAIGNEFVSSSVTSPLGGLGVVELTAIVAHQRYVSFGMGTAAWQAREEVAGLRGSSVQEVSTGSGVRLGFSAPLSDEVSLNFGLQSKLEMDSFESFRGIYADAGDFDVPARFQTELQWGVSPNAAISLGVERVFYGEIDAFTSAALPTRFLSLLADGASPEFAWRDLTIYSLEGAVADSRGGEWSLRYTTRQQPDPTSNLLRQALQSEFTDTNFALGYGRSLGDFGRLSMAASYAPSRYFLGASPYVQRDLTSGSQLEFEASWSIAF